ncbi:MAG: hypothetical protein GY804_12065 [Alphaproteobacteria bacterium]|nr:hypothetical protein [Alphaproteobacteria bacterium]
MLEDNTSKSDEIRIWNVAVSEDRVLTALGDIQSSSGVRVATLELCVDNRLLI